MNSEIALKRFLNEILDGVIMELDDGHYMLKFDKLNKNKAKFYSVYYDLDGMTYREVECNMSFEDLINKIITHYKI